MQHTIVHLLPPRLQPPQLLLALLILIVLLQTLRMARHSLVHRHHDPQRPSGSSQVQRQRGSEVGQFVGGGGRCLAVEVGADGQDEVGDCAGAVERREEFLRVVQQVGGHGAGVVGGDGLELQHGHDEGGLQDGAAEVDGGADYGEGLLGEGSVSWVGFAMVVLLLLPLFWMVDLGAIGLAWSGVNHQRLPVDAIMMDVMGVAVTKGSINEWWCW
jgi:hypothetical protein